MTDRKSIEFGLLVFAITTIMWCFSFSYMIGKISRDYEQKIEFLNKELNKNYDKK